MGARSDQKVSECDLTSAFENENSFSCVEGNRRITQIGFYIHSFVVIVVPYKNVGEGYNMPQVIGQENTGVGRVPVLRYQADRGIVVISSEAFDGAEGGGAVPDDNAGFHGIISLLHVETDQDGRKVWVCLEVECLSD